MQGHVDGAASSSRDVALDLHFLEGQHAAARVLDNDDLLSS